MFIPVLLVIFHFLLLENSESVCKLPNTGTVLFRNIDVHRKHCWSREEIALLYTRRAMMELIPRQIPHNIPLIFEFIKICLTTLKEQADASKEVYDYMFAVFADTFGGYLQTYGLPLLHESYYEGYVSYDNAAEFHNLQDTLKKILMTNGEGWTRPMEVRKHINRILPLKMPASVSSKPCSLLYTTELFGSSNQSNILIPLPILDDKKQLNSIAIPFKNHPLYNLKSRNSYDILIKYYIESSHCIAQSQKSGLEQSEFDHAFSNWLKITIIPHLKDEDWYVGFSNVLRIEETIQQRGGMIAAAQSEDIKEEPLFSVLESEPQMAKLPYIILLIIFTLLNLVFIFCLYRPFIKNCLLCFRREDVESSREHSSVDPSDTSLLLSSSDNYSNISSVRGKGKKGNSKNKNKSVTINSVPNSTENFDCSQSPKSVSQESRLTMSCGLGKGLPSKCHYHRH